MSGTKWVAPGEGATTIEIAKAVWHPPYTDNKKKALLRMRDIHTGPVQQKTNLALTGEPLTDYDLRRIAVCE